MSGYLRLICFVIVLILEQIKARLVISVILIKDGLAILTIWDPFDDYLVSSIEGLTNIDFDHHSISIKGEEKRYILG